MSQLVEREITCPACKQPAEVEVWSAMNVQEDPELKDLLLGGEINITECPACKETFYVDSFVLYHDPANEIMAFVFPMDDEMPRETLAEKMTVDFEATQATLDPDDRLAYGPVCFKGLNELVDFVERDEEVALQGEVVEAIAAEQRLPIRKLRPSQARGQNVPRVLPFMSETGRSERDALMAGLRRLREINDRLSVYNETLDRFSKDAAATLHLS